MFKESTIKAMYAKFNEEVNNALNTVTEDTPIHVLSGNRKTGPVASFSVMPLFTCANCGTCSKYCYAARMAKRLENVRNAYAINTAMVIKYPESVKRQLLDYIRRNKVVYFRWNVSGDFDLLHYFDIACYVVLHSPGTQFLSFTKCYMLFNNQCQHIHSMNEYSCFENVFYNWKVVFSMNTADTLDADIARWNHFNFPVTVVINDSSEMRPGWLACAGNCYECACFGFGCWHLMNGQILSFILH